ncbi:MAG: FYDLN acid domain-containing protein [Holosporales bacterium]|nr:FYDLN acid domain-containing protein [Holosporales bacterium]
MKLEWGKKICCPACSLPFYDMQRVSVVCPNCGKTFEVVELFTKKSTRPAVETDVIDIEDDELVISDFAFEEDESENTTLSEDSNELLVKTEINDMKLVDEE